MSCWPGLTVSYKCEAARGVHHENDSYMLALYTADAKLDEHTRAYSAAGEVRGAGYKAGGLRLENFEVVEDGSAAVLTWDDATWDKVTVRDVVGGLIYNATRGNKAVGVVKLTEPASATNGAFTVYFPTATAAEGLFVID